MVEHWIEAPCVMGSNPILDSLVYQDMFKKTYKFNRPIAPHLVIYTPQFSSLFSIWHRLSGIYLVLFIIFYYLCSEFFFNFIYLTNFLPTVFWFESFNYFIVILFLFYHCFNGLKQVYIDFLLSDYFH